MRMKLFEKILVLLICLVQVQDSVCSHFRGATFTYRPVDPSNAANLRVIISFRIGWRRSFNSKTYCDQSAISSGQLIGPYEELICDRKCYGTVGVLHFKCTDFSVKEDWTIGTNSFQYTFVRPMITAPLYRLSFRGQAWISTNHGSWSGSWRLRLYVNLTARNDTGRLNTSPVTSMSPVVRLKWGCNHTITIPVTDADNDEVRCRWAQGYDECGSICGGMPNAWMTHRECKITYRAVYYTGYYGVAAMIEDFGKPTDTEALSSIPLQFLVYVFTSNEPCDERPDFTKETRPKGSCIGIPPGGTYFDRIIVRAGGPSKSGEVMMTSLFAMKGLIGFSDRYKLICPTLRSMQLAPEVIVRTIRIVEVTTNSPQGFIKSPVALYAPQEYYVNVTWTPKSSKIETKIFCFTGLEDTGITTDQRCVSLLVGVAPPQIVSLSPTGEVLPNTRKWKITFDKQFVRPTRSNYIRIHHSDGTVVFSVDVAITAAVLYPVGSLGRTIEFTTSVSFTEKETYYVTLDPGVAKGVTYCGAESPPVRGPSTWSIKIKDVTAPVLTFVNAPSRSGSDVIITWSANENVTAQCTVQTPTQITAHPCNNMSWSGTNLSEGYHSIYVQLTDSAGNTASPSRHSWFVDRTPPQVTITSKPTSPSNQNSFTFRFSCGGTCSFQCSVAQMGSRPAFTQCNSNRYTASRLQNGLVYVFQVRGTDDVGNQGSSVNYTWKVDLQPPTISSMSVQRVDCTSDLSPSALGKPSVSDNEGPNITLTYSDIPGGSCSFQRKWTATDLAGNSASKIQVINLSNLQAPTVIYNAKTTIACGSFEDRKQDMREAINVTHPCNRPITITHVDSVASILCGTTITRTWTIADDCGKQVSIIQRIRILPLQLPDYPKNGQVNVALREALRWPQYPGAVRYNVYLWRYGGAKPSSPTTWTRYYRSYSPYAGYPADSRLLWRIEYVLSSGALIPSPVWGFKTRAFPDFKVEKVMAPPNAFSGQTFEVSWTVRNIGKVGNLLVTWVDAVFIGKSTDFRRARFATSVRHREILFQNDGYTSKGTARLRVNEFGVFYVFVATDWYDRIFDMDRSNDVLLGNNPVQVLLTPPPNLKVEKIVVPSPSFSGKAIDLTWSVKNYGMGVTAYDAWYDRVYLSKDNNRDWSDWLLGTFYHRGVLPVDASYSTKRAVTLPHAIFGNFSILVITDVYNYVYEHNDEDDNLKSQHLKIDLSPPPDLVVHSIVTASQYYTGDAMKVEFNVSNEGLGEPFYHWWRDRVTIASVTSNYHEVLGTTYFSGVFPPLSMYSRTLYHAIPPSWPTGLYNITVVTDYFNDVFEYIFDNNNAKTVQVNIVQKLPDLTVAYINASATADIIQAYVRVLFLVKNVGPGKTTEAPWVDAVYISPQADFSRPNAVWLGDFPRRINLDSANEYSFDTGPIRINRDNFGQRYIHVLIDVYQTVAEQNVSNNIKSSANVTFPQVVPDLVVTNFSLVGKNILLSDSDISLWWTVENNGTGSTLSNSWRDTVYLSTSPRVEGNSSKLSVVYLSPKLSPGLRYSQVSSTRLPSNVAGKYYLILQVNDGGYLTEIDDGTKNSAWVPIRILPAPLPDLEVVRVSFVFVAERRFLTVSWKVSNIGSWMRESYSWADKVVLSPSRGKIDDADARVLAFKTVSAKLDENQDYELSVSVQIENTVKGRFYVNVITNVEKSVTEVSGVSNNIGVAAEILTVPIPPGARLILSIVSMPPKITSGIPFSITFRVTNVGFVTTSKTSWTDALYAYTRNDANRTEVIEMGVKLDVFSHIGALPAQAFYEVTSSITVPHGLNSSAFIYGFADIFNPTIPDVDEPTQPDNVTHPTVTPLAPPIIVINEGLLPDLWGSLGDQNVHTRGGQPLNVTFNVTNGGEYPVQGAWYNAFYLSQDLLVDPFDVRLATVRAVHLAVNDTVSLTVVVFIPFDTLDTDYYLLLSVDNKNTIWESNEQNNEASLLITINKILSSDLAVVLVSSSGGQFHYGEDVTVNWKIRNNGSQRAEGYKCDTVYLSRDDIWQIEDVRIGNPMCSYVTLEPYQEGANPDKSYSMTEKLSLTGIGGYHGLVKTRSNILDLNQRNNIAVGPKNINVTFPSLPLDGCVDVTIKSGEEKSYIVESVPDERTLIVTVNSSSDDAIHEMFVRHAKPATAYQYDGGPRFVLSADQEVIIPKTIVGRYYVLIRRSDMSANASTSRLCARIAKFEIIRVSPNGVAPLGNATLRFEGTLFGQDVEAFLIDASAMQNVSIKATEVYRMSSTELYATFVTTSFIKGATFHVKLVNVETKEEAILPRSLAITRGEPGRLETHVDFPEVLRMLSQEDDTGDTGVVTVLYGNVGDTDIAAPLLALSVTDKQVQLRPVQRDKPSPQASTTVVFLAQAFRGPGGILPPKAYGEITFDIVQSNMRGAGGFALRIVVGDKQPHFYMNSSDQLKPDFLREELWAPVWRNFLFSVGRTVSSFQNRITAASTFLSRSGRRVNLLTDLVQFQLDVANGKLTGEPLILEDDLSGQSSPDDSLPLTLQRMYSPLLTKRRGKGVFGTGWMSPWWEAEVIQITQKTIRIVQLREELVFDVKATGLFESVDGKKISVNNTELYLYDTSISTVFTFDTLEKHLIKIQKGGQAISIEYSHVKKRPLTLRHSSGSKITVSYSDNGLVREARLVDESGNSQRCFYTYDEENLISITVGEQTTRYKYNLKGDLTWVIYPTMAAVEYSWNHFELLSGIASFNQEKRLIQGFNFSYDWNGKVTVFRAPQGDSVELVFSEKAEMMDIISESFSDLRFESASKDDQVIRTVKQGDQVIMKRQFNKKTNTMTVVDANEHETQFLLSKEEAKVLNTTDPDGFVYENVYSNESKLIQFKYPDGKTELYDYDRFGRLVKFTDRSSKELRFQYDEKGRIVRKDVEGLASSYFLHDDEGSVNQATNDVGTINIGYDSKKRPTRIIYPNKQDINFRYNDLHRRVALTVTPSRLSLTYTYDQFNRLAQIGRVSQSGTEDILLRVEYDAHGMVSKRILGSGAYSDYLLDSKNFNLLRLRNYFPNGSLASFFEYNYDNKGRIMQVNTTSGSWRYKYDAASQLVESEDPQGQIVRYAYDKRKNRIYVSEEPGNKTLYAANEVNQYTAAGNYDIKYDSNGNVKEKIHKEVRTDRLKVTFSPEDILLQTETPNKRCNFIYDSLGNLYKKKCGKEEVQYIVDPFGNPGADIIGQISGGKVTHFVHCEEFGLVAIVDMNGDLYYYEFDGIGSVVGVLGPSGDRVNKYMYDPFGRMLKRDEQFPQDFTFVGQWGVTAEREFKDVYWMRSRYYDAQLGRFFSLDPLGFSGQSINLYSYAANNPVMLKDPRGRCLKFANLAGGPLGALLGAGTSVAAYVASKTVHNQKVTLGGLVSSAVTGAISSFVKGPKALVGFATSLLGSVIEQKTDNGRVNWKKALDDGINGAISSALPPFKKGCNPIIDDFNDKYTKNTFLPPVTSPIVKNLTNFTITWIQSWDPNDIIGPPGYGEARFISLTTPLNYKIRFENEANATAPAQHVIILHTLDQDLDMRTFRVTSFGFGNFTRKLTNARASIQETIDFVSEKMIYVRVLAGINVVTREARWEFQSLDPQTGEPPDDPRIGFLPPNNGTTGQGFVTFTVGLKKNLPSLTRIDAQANIYFDKNEPIETPPIFNTIDSSPPSSNISAVRDVMKVGILAVDIDTQDKGSGVKSVDIYYQKISGSDAAQDQSFLPLLSGITQDTAFLPVPPGYKYMFVASAVDHVGNRQSLDLNKAITVDFELQKPSCERLNNCSSHGNCTVLNFCICEDGFYGINCSFDYPLRFLDPIMNVMYSDTIEDNSTLLYLSAFIPDVDSSSYNSNFTLKIIIDGLPQGFTLNRGKRNGSCATLELKDFGNVLLMPRKDFSGIVRLNVTAQAQTPRETKLSSSQIEINIEAAPDVPHLNVSISCYHWNSSEKIIPVFLESQLSDRDGSENLTITASGFPTSSYRLVETGFSRVKNGSNETAAYTTHGWFITFNGTLTPFVLRVTATAEEKSNGEKANKTMAVDVLFCVTCEAVNNCSGSGKCVRVNTCDCKSGFKGSPDCSEVSCERVSNCSSHGNCTGPNVCDCQNGYKSIGCAQVSCELVDRCSGHGNCSGPNECTCYSGYKGINCSEVTCESLNNCSSHGNCTGPNKCTCERGFKGAVDCSEVSCESLNHCSEQGDCVGPNVCNCHAGFKGLQCLEVTCVSLSNCSNRGDCTGPNVCTCKEGFQGAADCSKVSCESLNNCSGHGNCSGPNVCTCHAGFKGISCSKVSCYLVNNCSDHGACTGPDECTCEKGFQGEDCSEVVSEDEGSILKSISTPAIIGISVGMVIVVVTLCAVLIFCCKRRRMRQRRSRPRPQRKSSTAVFRPPNVPSTVWVFTTSSEPGSKAHAPPSRPPRSVPVCSYQNPAYQTGALTE